MAVDVERLVVSLEARIDKMSKELGRAVNDVNRTTNSISKQFDRMSGNIESRTARAAKVANDNLKKISFAPAGEAFKGFAGGGVLGGLAAIGGPIAGFTAAAVKAGDAWITMGNKLRSAGVAQDQLSNAQKKSVDIALSTHSDLEATNDLYAKMIAVTNMLGKSQLDAAKATKALTGGLTLAGTSSETAAATILQVGQALQSGKLQGDEFRSMMEGLGETSPIVQRLAQNLHTTVGALKQMGADGKITSEDLIDALTGAGDEIEKKLTSNVLTIGQAFTDLKTSVTALFASIGASELVKNTAAEIEWLANKIDFLIQLREKALELTKKENKEAEDNQQAAKIAEITAQIDAQTESIAKLQRGIDALKANPDTLDPGRLPKLEQALKLEQQILETLKTQLMVAQGVANAQKDGAQAAKDAAEGVTEATRETARGRALSGLNAADFPTGTGGVTLQKFQADQAAKEAQSDKEKKLNDAIDKLTKTFEKAGFDVSNAIVQASIKSLAQQQIANDEAKDATKKFSGDVNDLVSKIIMIESGGRNIKSATGNAAGLGQFMPGTWVQFIKARHPDMLGMSDLQAQRFNIPLMKEAIGWLIQQNREQLISLGVSADKISDGAIYLAHFLGAGGAAKVLKADAGTPISQVVDAKSIAANRSILAGKTAGEVRAWAEAKMAAAGPGGAIEVAGKAADAWDKLIKGSGELTEKKLAEARAIGLSANAKAYEEEKQRLLNEAEKEGIELTPEKLKDIEDKAKAAGRAAQEYEDASKKLQDTQQLQQYAGDAITNFFTDVITGSKSAKDALKDLLNSLIKVSIQALLMGQGPLAGLFGTAPAQAGGVGGILGGLFGGFGGLFKAEGGPVEGEGTGDSDSIPAWLSKGEFVVRARQAGRYRAVLDAINSGKAIRFARGGAVMGPGTPSYGMPAMPAIAGFAGPNDPRKVAVSVEAYATPDLELRIVERADTRAAARDQALGRTMNKGVPQRVESARKLGT